MSEKAPQRKHTVRKFRLEHWMVISLLLMGYDSLVMAGSYFVGLWLRFDCRFSALPAYYFDAFLRFTPFYIVMGLMVFWSLRLYHSIWRFASYTELMRTILATLITSVIHTVGITVFFYRMPISYYVIGPIVQFFLTMGIRFSYRFVLLQRDRLRESRTRKGHGRRVMLIGAGAAGQMLLRDIRGMQQTADAVCCIIDDNRNKWGRSVDGVPIVGGRDDILVMAEKYGIDEIVLAIPSASAKDKRDILSICKESGCILKSLPGLYQMISGDVTVGHLREVAVEDLLGREQIQVNMQEIYQSLRGKTVLITGAGGSIGSELARQVAAHEPGCLVLLDEYENGVYDIQQELCRRYPQLRLEVRIGSVRDLKRLLDIFGTFRPQVVYHAAAHKHVPLMEFSPCEAIKNNVFGTYRTAMAALCCGCQRFVLISTDKAVNPTNIMGASKRMCEMIIQTFDRMIREGTPEKLLGKQPEIAPVRDLLEKCMARGVHTDFVAVRFGNVLGSNGSVVPLFKRQIAEGGPVTVTEPDIIRYFMTIPEAVSLVLQAGVYAKGGEIFVFDMGEPVKIDTLARNLIKLSGFKPDVDIKIEYTGLRPGEKLYEEKLMKEEGMRRTPNELIHIGAPLPIDADHFLSQLRELEKTAEENDDGAIRRLAEEIVPTYRPDTGNGRPRQAG